MKFEIGQIVWFWDGNYFGHNLFKISKDHGINSFYGFTLTNLATSVTTYAMLQDLELYQDPNELLKEIL